MQLSVAAGVARVTFDAAVVGVHIQFDAPSNLRHCEVDAGESPARPANEVRLTLDGHAAVTQLLGEHDLGVRLPRRSASESMQRLPEPVAPTPRRMAEAFTHRHQLVECDAPFVEQLVQHRDGREAPDRRQDRMPAGPAWPPRFRRTDDECAWPAGRWSDGTQRPAHREGGGHGARRSEVGRRWPSAKTEHRTRGRPRDEPTWMRRAQHGATHFERGFRRGEDVHTLVGTPQNSGAREAGGGSPERRTSCPHISECLLRGVSSGNPRSAANTRMGRPGELGVGESGQAFGEQGQAMMETGQAMRAAPMRAAPTMPASLVSAAGTTSTPTSMWESHLSVLRLTPPPTMMRSGEKRNTMRSR